MDLGRGRRPAPAAGVRQHPAHPRRAPWAVLRDGDPLVALPAPPAASRRPRRQLPRHRPRTDLARPAHTDRHARELARRRPGRIRTAAARHLLTDLDPVGPGGGFQPVHARLRQRRPPAPVRGGLHRRRHRTGRDRPADRLPAHPVRRLQPPRAGGDPAPVARGRTRLGTGDPRPAVAGRHRDRAARAVPLLGTARLRHRREPLHVPRPARVPLAAAPPQLDRRPRRRHGRGRHATRPHPEQRPARGPPDAARRIQRTARHRPLPAFPVRPRPRSRDPDPAHLPGVRRRRRDGGGGRLPAERTAEQAWPHFHGWRVNYETIAYELCRRGDAVPALWTGPRDFLSTPIPPARPADRRPGEDRPELPPAAG